MDAPSTPPPVEIGAATAPRRTAPAAAVTTAAATTTTTTKRGAEASESAGKDAGAVVPAKGTRAPAVRLPAAAATAPRKTASPKELRELARRQEAERKAALYRCVDRAAWTRNAADPAEPARARRDVLVASTLKLADGTRVALDLCGGADLDKAEREELMGVVRGNMRAVCEASAWGWNENKKLRELCDADARVIRARDAASGALAALAHVRFLVESEEPTLYVYEFQVAPAFARRGLGRRLMTVVEMTARATDMAFVKLTVLLNNRAARDFYAALRFERDPDSPLHEMRDPERDGVHDILSKDVRLRSE